MSFSSFFFVMVIVYFAISSCSRENEEGTSGAEQGELAPLSSRGKLIDQSMDEYQDGESNYSAVLSSPDTISLDQATFSEMIDFNEDGQCFDKKTGTMIEGRFRILSQTGSLLSSSSFKNGFYHGKREEYHENGVPSLSSNYIFGKKNGLEQWRSENGIKTYEANFRQGAIEGIETAWGENGQVLSKFRFKEGEVVERLFENGVFFKQ
jgi:hypothetical protein